MKETDLRCWKQFVEGIARGLIGPFEQRNIHKGDDSWREYWDLKTKQVVARMCVYGCNKTLDTEALVRKFEIDDSIYKLCDKIYVPTQADFDEWEDNNGDVEWAKQKGIIA